MKYRTLGRSGLNVSIVGIGTWQFSGEWAKNFDQSEVDALINTARELGINLIDTAECYGDHLAEKLIGQAIAHDRDKWIIATKFGHRFIRPFERKRDYSPEAVLEQLEASLRALRTTYIDIYQFHSAEDGVFDDESLWNMLGEQVRIGKVLNLGISINRNDHLHQVEKATEVGANVIQLVYNRIDRAPESEVFQSCQRQNLGVLVRVPLASGFLTGKYAPGFSFPADDVREKWYHEGRDKILSEVEQIHIKEVPSTIPMAAWALAWCLRHPAVTSVIPGCKNIAQLKTNASAADLLEEF